MKSRLIVRFAENLAARGASGGVVSACCAFSLTMIVAAARALTTGLAAVLMPGGGVWSGVGGTIADALVWTLVAGLGVWLLAAALRHWPRWGWAVLSAAAAFSIAVAVLVPPLTLLPKARGDQPTAEATAAPILAFIRRGGLPVSSLFVFDSPDPVAVDMEGLGSLSHAAVSRAALAAPRPETNAAVGHLLGHYRYKDLWTLSLIWSAVAAIFFWAAGKVTRRIARRIGASAASWRLNARTLPAVALIAWGLAAAATPAFNLFDQTINYRADDYALSLTHDPDALCRWLIAADDDAKADPSPLEAILFYDHPPLKARLVNASRWRLSP